LDDFSQQAIDDDLEQTRRFLDRFEAIDTAGLPEQEALNKQLMIRDLKMALEGARFKPWEMPVNQSSGIHIDAPQLVSVLSFENVKDYEDYITRLRQLPILFDQTVAQMRKGMAIIGCNATIFPHAAFGSRLDDGGAGLGAHGHAAGHPRARGDHPETRGHESAGSRTRGRSFGLASGGRAAVLQR